jgi:hypothetical protein
MVKDKLVRAGLEQYGERQDGGEGTDENGKRQGGGEGRDEARSQGGEPALAMESQALRICDLSPKMAKPWMQRCGRARLGVSLLCWLVRSGLRE